MATRQPEELVSMLLDRIGYNNIYSFDEHGGRTNDKQCQSFYNVHFNDKLDRVKILYFEMLWFGSTKWQFIR